MNICMRLSSVKFTVYRVQCTVYSVQCTVYSVVIIFSLDKKKIEQDAEDYELLKMKSLR